MFIYFQFFSRACIWYCFFVVTCYGQNANKAAISNKATLMEYTAHYDVYRKGEKHGKATRILSIDDNSLYTLTFKTDASMYFYSINTEESSQFSYEGHQIKPLKYSSKDDRTFKKTKHQVIQFDYAKGTVLGGGKTTEWSLPLEPNIFDPLLAIEKMTQGIQGTNQSMEYSVYDKNSVKTYLFEYTGRETIETPMGQVDTVKVSRVRKNSSRKTHFWLSVDHNFIPFRVEQIKNGKEVATLEINKLLVPAMNSHS
jgi:hypothetical protein